MNYIQECVLHDKAEGHEVEITPAIFVTEESNPDLYELLKKSGELIFDREIMMELPSGKKVIHYHPFSPI